MGSEAGPYQVDTQLPEEMGSITRARGITRRALAECAFLGPHEDVLLVVSELVTNALVHGDGPPVLRLRCTRTQVRVEVSDSGSDLPEPREPGPSSGWGLHVIELLSAGWGVSRGDEGKAVWCELTARLIPLAQERSTA
jgi:anti-sigma regulatory factor (Ser/Thr protein kinase)